MEWAAHSSRRLACFGPLFRWPSLVGVFLYDFGPLDHLISHRFSWRTKAPARACQKVLVCRSASEERRRQTLTLMKMQ
jgi:hypothetical protein